MTSTLSLVKEYCDTVFTGSSYEESFGHGQKQEIVSSGHMLLAYFDFYCRLQFVGPFTICLSSHIVSNIHGLSVFV